MYLMAILLLLLSLLGVFVQIFALQTAQMFANQKAMGQTLLTWHNAAVGFARHYPSTSALPCSLGPVSPDGTMALCTTRMSAANTVNMADPALTFLPKEYNFSRYQWYSVLFVPSDGVNPAETQRYVITYVPTTAVTDGLIVLPNALGISMGDLFNQLRRVKAPALSYGYVSTVSGKQVLTNTSNYQYLLTPKIPSGAIAIVSTL